MKSILALAVLAMATSSVALGQMTKDKHAPKGKGEQELLKLERERAQATVKGDLAFLDRTTSDDYTGINEVGELRTKAELLDGFKAGSIKFVSNDVEDLNVRIYGNAAVVTGRAISKELYQGTDFGAEYRFTRVYVKREGNWQSVAYQSTRIAHQ